MAGANLCRPPATLRGWADVVRTTWGYRQGSVRAAMTDSGGCAGASAADALETYSTADPFEAHEWLRAAYADHSVELHGNEEDFKFTSAKSSVGPLTFSGFQHSMGATVTVGDDRASFIAFRVSGGSYEVARDGQVLQVGRGGTALLPPHGPLAIRWTNVEVAAVGLDSARLRESAADLTGQDGQDVTFDLSQPVTSAAERRWWQTVGYADQVLRRSTAGAGPLLRAEVSRLLTAAALETFPNTAPASRPVRLTFPGRPWLRRALTFIDDHADQDLRLSDIAAAARVSPRALQAGFRAHLGITPLDHLRGVRLELAHQDLRAGSAEAGDTVGAIADRWGFSHHGRFAAAYAQRYGRHPRETLRS